MSGAGDGENILMKSGLHVEWLISQNYGRSMLFVKTYLRPSSISQGVLAGVQSTKLSLPPNQSEASRSPFSGLSLPWITFLPTSMAKSPRIVPGSDSKGLVAPMSLRADFTTPLPSHTIATTGPEMMYSTWKKIDGQNHSVLFKATKAVAWRTRSGKKGLLARSL